MRRFFNIDFDIVTTDGCYKAVVQGDLDVIYERRYGSDADGNRGTPTAYAGELRYLNILSRDKNGFPRAFQTREIENLRDLERFIINSVLEDFYSEQNFL